MNNCVRPRRSALYMPCSNLRALVKAQTLAADVLLFDLEDAVALEAKSQARTNIVQALQEHDYGYREKIVRINAVDTELGYADLKALSSLLEQGVVLEGVCLPKVESAEQINKALAVLGHRVPIWVMIETPLGVLNVAAIAAHEQVKVLVLGTNDLAKELRVQQSAERTEFSYAFGHCIMAARAYGCDVLDGVYNQFDNEAGLQQVCIQGKGWGFDGKTLIHPSQLMMANQIFMPSQHEIAEAQAIMSAWEAAKVGVEASGTAVVVLNGRIVEELHVQAAQRLMLLVDAIHPEVL